MTKEEAIFHLSDLRSYYNCFSQEEADTYHALSMGIEALKMADAEKDYYEICEQILDGMSKLAKKNRIPKKIYLSTSWYSTLLEGYKKYANYDNKSKLTCFGMDVECRDFPFGQAFLVTDESEGMLE